MSAGGHHDASPAVDVEAVLARARFDDRGLVTVVAQQVDTREVLMVAHADAAALRETLETRRATYWSRSRRARWRKGDTSGHVQHVVTAALDCDGDTVLLEVDQVGAACHEGTRTCFDGRRVLGPRGAEAVPGGVDAAASQGAASQGATSGKAASGKATSQGATSGKATSGKATSGKAASDGGVSR